MMCAKEKLLLCPTCASRFFFSPEHTIKRVYPVSIAMPAEVMVLKLQRKKVNIESFP